MIEMFQLFVQQIGHAFSVMANWEIFPNVSLLSIFITLIILHTLIKVIWIDTNTREKRKKDDD